MKNTVDDVVQIELRSDRGTTKVQENEYENNRTGVLERAIEKLKQLEVGQLCYSYNETPDIWKNNKPIYTKGWQWCHGANWNNLHEVTKSYGYSNAVFTDGYRTSGTTEYLGNLLIYDYDDPGITIVEMLEKLTVLKVSALIATTLSHQKEKKGVICDRFRLLLQLNDYMGSSITTSIMEVILEEVSTALGLGKQYDTACKTIERFYSPAPIQQHWYIEGEVLDIQNIIDEAKKPIPAPIQEPRRQSSYRNTGLSLKEMRKYVSENIPHDTVVRELEAKDLNVSHNGAICLDRKKVGNIHPETRFIRNWAESESMDIIGILEKFYGESYVDNTKRLYEEIK